MKTSIVLSLDTRRPKADGTYPIVLRISHFGKVSQLVLGVYLKKTDWNNQERCIKASYKGTESVTRLNNRLQKKKAEALDTISKLDEQKTLTNYSVVQLKQLIERKPQQGSFFEYAEKVITDLKEANRIGTAETHETALRALKRFINGRDLKFYEINLDFLNRFEIQHLKKGKSYNGLSVYLRSIRSLFNQAIKAKIVDQELYPFKSYEIKSVKTRKRAISLEAIERIEALQYQPGHPLFNTRNYFLVSFYCRGMTFADLAHLKRSNIIDGRIYYQRMKTDKPYNVKILPQIQLILNHYVINKEPEDYLFPIIRRDTADHQYQSLKWARKRYNKKLELLAKECNIQEHLTSYVSRHSFATRAKNLGIATASISDMLGHGDIKTTQVYLDSLPNDMLDNLHEQVISKAKNTP